MKSIKNIPFHFNSNLWKHNSEGGWHFVSLPQGLSNEIRSHFGTEEEGWGRLKVRAEIGTTVWDTAIWFDTKRNTYLLPVKSEARKREKISDGDELKVKIWI